jgi:hypothetical protein
MNESFLKSVGNIRTESFDMLANVRSVRGEMYARLVHAVILSDNIQNAAHFFCDTASEESKELANYICKAQMNMVGQIMKYYIKSSGFTEEQMCEVFADAQRIQESASELIDKARVMSESGKVMGE